MHLSELACFFLERMGVTHQVVPCTTEEYPTAAPRPKNTILENRRLCDQDINLMPWWKDDVEEFVSLYRDRLVAEVSSSEKP